MTEQDEHCPVCQMAVAAGNLALEYQGMHFAFCSQQCRERFEANPHLYVGRPGQPSPKQQGKEVIKLRTLRLQHALTPEQASCLIEELQAMMGVKEVEVEDDRIRIRYDLLQATVEQIEQRIEAIGDRLGGGLGETLRRAFIHYLEETELANLEEGNGGHGHHH